MKIKICSWLYSLFLLMLSFPVCAESWLTIGIGASGDRYYYDAASVSKNAENRVTYWGKVEYESAGGILQAIQMRRSLGLKTAGYSNLKASFALDEMDCTGRRARNLASKDVDRSGKVLDQQRLSGSWNEISPGTIYDRIFSLVCH